MEAVKYGPKKSYVSIPGRIDSTTAMLVYLFPTFFELYLEGKIPD